jgi:hypothetical protein
VGTEQEVITSVRQHLLRQQIEDVNVSQFLLELAQWYGLLIPVSAQGWGFSHRTIHDFLAARYWVESGGYSPDQVDDWNTRAAYAMSIMPNATDSLKKALRDQCEIHVLSQCLFNNAIFDPSSVAISIIDYFGVRPGVDHWRGPASLAVGIDPSLDFFADASNQFLQAMVNAAIVRGPSGASDLVLAYSLYEFCRRGEAMPSPIFSRTLQYLDYSKFEFSVRKAQHTKTFSLDQIKRR